VEAPRHPSDQIAAQDRIDLHLHTTYSDGHWAPVDLFDYLAEADFRVVAITDHDRVDRLDEMRALGAARGITVLPGVEVTTDWNGQFAHLLCYGFAPARGALREVTARIHAEQTENARLVHAALIRRGMAFPRQGALLAASGGAITHPTQNILLLREHGYVESYQAGVRLVTEMGHRSACAALPEAVAAAHRDGGVAILAHPGRADAGCAQFTPALLDAVRAEGIPLDGIEVYYPTYTPDQVRAFEAYALAQDWLRSCGSDSHGPQQRYPIPYPAAHARDLLARCGLTVRD
jgi:predicted metal-dependent phosphoesterase TrpH